MEKEREEELMNISKNIHNCLMDVNYVLSDGYSSEFEKYINIRNLIMNEEKETLSNK